MAAKTSQKCTLCNKTKKLSSFYVNKLSKDGNGHNFWCTECTKKRVFDKSSMEEYCINNARRFRLDLWEWCKNRTTSLFENDVEFNSLGEKEKENKFMTKVINTYFSQQNQSQYYEYISHESEEIDDDLKKNLGNQDLEKKEKKIYSDEWRGCYTSEDLQYLNEYYESSCEDFNVVTRNHKDYLRKIAKASLAMDKAFEDKMNGVPGADKAYKDAKEVFDSLSQSAKFSEKTRSNNDVAGLGSLSEIVAKLEQTGFLQRKITYEKDDIDKINEDLRWVLTSVGGDL